MIIKQEIHKTVRQNLMRGQQSITKTSQTKHKSYKNEWYMECGELLMVYAEVSTSEKQKKSIGM